MKYLVSSILLLFNFTILSSQEIKGTWKGDLEVQGTKLPLVFNIKQNENKLVSTMDSPMQGAKDIPVTSTTFEKNELVLSIPTMQIHYKGVLKGDKIEGTFSQGQMSLPFTLSRKKDGEAVLKRPQTPQPPFNYNVEDVTFINPVDKNTLTGTLTTPVTKKDFPVVVLISGSGQQNRNCELFGHQSFWVIADDFAK
ncbi:MAG: alpha/beta hydrolase, partial [Flavobacterium sp.]|nr:alpha/beta hydrolase [Flavobacterium sp.]